MLPFGLVSGLVCTVASTGKCTLIRHHFARVWVEWADRILPAGVHYGAHVSVIGNLVTFNVGAGFQLTNACLLDVAPQAMIAAALQRYPDAVIPPRGKTIRRKAVRKIEMPSGRSNPSTRESIAPGSKSTPSESSAPGSKSNPNGSSDAVA